MLYFAFMFATSWNQPLIASDSLQILAESSLMIVPAIEPNSKLWTASKEGLSPVLADWITVMFSKQEIDRIFYGSKQGQRSLRQVYAEQSSPLLSLGALTNRIYNCVGIVFQFVSCLVLYERRYRLLQHVSEIMLRLN
jgi:hypothetical protein